MATLTARGHKELARVTLERDTPNDELVFKRKDERVYRSDGTILEKHVVWLRPDSFTSKERRHDYGWKVRQKVKNMVVPTMTAEQWTALHVAKGWRVE